MDPRSLRTGDVVDGFRLDAPLDPGGMASFWRVSRPDIEFPVLMKVPSLGGGEAHTSLVGFEAEQMILPRLSGPHVPRFVASGGIERPYIVMEFVAGRLLKSLLDRLPLPPDEVATIGAKIAFAVHDIHRQNVLHLDLKPSNVIFRDNGEAVLIDFGLSRHMQLPDLVGEELDGPVGSAAYIAPEQVIGDRGDPRSDIFSLGVILYFLATGTRPFGEPRSARDWKKRLWRDPVPPRRLNAAVPPALQEVILHCLEPMPDDRHATAAQAAFDLQHIDQVKLTARAERMTRDGWLRVLMRRLKFRSGFGERRTVQRAFGQAPIIMVAVDFSTENTALGGATMAVVRRLLATQSDARIACVNVIKTSRLAIDSEEDEAGRNLHLQRLIELKHWAADLSVLSERVTYHVFEAIDPATALIDYARNNRVDHIVIGARGSSTLRRYLGSVSSQVVAQAPCTVTVVRAQQPDAAASASGSDASVNVAPKSSSV